MTEVPLGIQDEAEDAEHAAERTPSDLPRSGEAEPPATAQRLHKRRQRQRKMDQKRQGVDEVLAKVKVRESDLGGGAHKDANADANADHLPLLRSLFRSLPPFDVLHSMRDSLARSWLLGDTQTSDLKGAAGGAQDISRSSVLWSSDMPAILTPDESELTAECCAEPSQLAEASELAGNKGVDVMKGEAQRQAKYQKKLLKKLADGDIDAGQMEEMLEKHGRQAQSKRGEHEDAGAESEEKFSLLSADRGLRKRQQIENFVSLLLIEKSLCGSNACAEEGSVLKKTRRRTVVDFGCGSGNLCLPLAHFFRNDTDFIFTDRNPHSLKIVQARAAQAGLTNVRVMPWDFTFANVPEFLAGERVDYVIGLHCCGSFTDIVMEFALLKRASCVVCPCCNGKMDDADSRRGFEESGGVDQSVVEQLEAEQLECQEVGAATATARQRALCCLGRPQYPRSLHFRSCCGLSRAEYTAQLCRAADDLTRGDMTAKSAVEYDRAVWARELIESSGFDQVFTLKLNPVSCSPKHHVLYLWNNPSKRDRPVVPPA